MVIWLTDFPLPPSVNVYLKPYRSRLIKSDIHRQYTNECLIWGMKNNGLVKEVYRTLKEMKDALEKYQKPFALQVDCYFAFHRSRVLTLKNQAQQLDTNNFIKAAIDGLVKVIGIDDKYYFSGGSEKVTVDPNQRECTLLRITPMKPRTLADIQALIKL